MTTEGYKVLTAAEWAGFAADGSFAGSPDDRRDGFIHLSTADQLAGTLDRHYAGVPALVLARVDLASLGAALRWEPSRGGELFPHLYASLPMHALRGTAPVARGPDGAVVLPPRQAG